MVNHKQIYKRIQRIRNCRNPFEMIAQRMEMTFNSYKGGVHNEQVFLDKLFQLENEAIEINNKINS